MCKVIAAGFKGLPALLLLPHFLPFLLALFPGKGLWHPALVTILSGPHLMQGREGPLVIFNWVWNSPTEDIQTCGTRLRMANTLQGVVQPSHFPKYPQHPW